MKQVSLALVLLVLLGSRVLAADNEYAEFTDSIDVSLHDDAPDTAFQDGSVSADGGNTHQFIARFENIFGDTPDKVSRYSKIVDARLRFVVLDTGAGSVSLTDRDDWTEASTWNSLTGGIADDLDGAPFFNYIRGGTNPPFVLSTVITSQFQNWTNDLTATTGFAWQRVGGSHQIYDHEGQGGNPANQPQMMILFVRPIKGDMDIDGDVDLDDVGPFVQALNDAALYESLYGFPAASRGDIDGDGDLDLDDVDPFVVLLTEGPE